MRKVLVVPLLLPVVGFAAVKGYYWYQVKESVDRLVGQVAPYGELSYQSVVAGFDGKAGVEGVVFRPRFGSVELTAKRVMVSADSWTDFLKGASWAEGAALPKSLTMHLEGVHTDLNQLDALVTSSEESDEILGCERAGSGGLPFWKALGYGSLYTNLDLGYQFNPENGYLRALARVETPTVFSLDASSSIATGGAQLSPGSLGAAARLSEVSLTVQDDSYNQRRNSYCANLNGENIAAFVNRHADLLASRYRSFGLQLGDELVDAYRKYLLTRGRVELRLVANDPIALASLDPGLLADQLTARLRVNGEAVEPLEVAWQAPEVSPSVTAQLGGLVKAADQQPAPNEATPAVAVADEEAAGQQPAEGEGGSVAESPEAAKASDSNPYQLTQVRRVSKPTYQEVEVPQLPAYIGEKMQVDTLNGHRIEGVLDSVIKNQLRLKQEFDGGEAILPIRFDLIRVVRVLR